MKTRGGSKAPVAVPYTGMAAYRPASELHLGLYLLAERIGEERTGHARLLKQKATRTLLLTAEAGARPELWRRAFLYRCAWFSTYDIEAALRSARRHRLVPADAMLGTDTLVRMAQQALTLTAGTMLERKGKAEGRTP